jgi:hypothetical protein
MLMELHDGALRRCMLLCPLQTGVLLCVSSEQLSDTHISSIHATPGTPNAL